LTRNFSVTNEEEGTRPSPTVASLAPAMR
jgi:hypothetical protein